MKAIGIIPARGGSKRVPRKNVKLLAGKPLINYTIEAAKEAKLEKVIVSTDDNEIAEAAKAAGAEVIMRPAELAQDETPTLPVIQHAVGEVEKSGYKAEAIVTLQATSPVRKKGHIDEALRMLEETGAESVVSVRKVRGEALRKVQKGEIKEIDGEYFMLNGSLFVTRRDVLMDGSLYGSDCRALVMEERYSVDIDTEADFAFAEALINENKN